jgi:hypothetical protein
MQWDCRLSTGLPPTSWLCQLWSWKEDLQQAWNWDRRAVWDQVGLSHCWHNGLLMVRDEASLRRGHNDQSRWGHQCSETMLTGESQFHIRPPGDWTWVPHDGKQTGGPLDQWTVYGCSEIAGSPRISIYVYVNICCHCNIIRGGQTAFWSADPLSAAQQTTKIIADQR